MNSYPKRLNTFSHFRFFSILNKRRKKSPAKARSKYKMAIKNEIAEKNCFE